MATTSSPLRISEKQFMGQVIQLARLCGWLAFHPFDSRRSAPGYPDLCMARAGHSGRPARLIFAELKSHKGKLTAAQSEWLKVLGQVPGIEVFCWQPNHWDQIVEVLKRS